MMLAQEVGADLLLVDERAAWREAATRGLTTMGTLGVLDTAAERGLVDFGDAVQRHRQTTFHVSEAVLHPLLEQDLRRARLRDEEPVPGRED